MGGWYTEGLKTRLEWVRDPGFPFKSEGSDRHDPSPMKSEALRCGLRSWGHAVGLFTFLQEELLLEKFASADVPVLVGDSDYSYYHYQMMIPQDSEI